MVKLQEAENQIVIADEVYDRRPSDSDLLIAAIETHQAMLGCTPRWVAADAGFYSAKNDAAAKAKGVKRVCVPNRATKNPERKREQKKIPGAVGRKTPFLRRKVASAFAGSSPCAQTFTVEAR
jgi:IS5 family transposase